MCYLFMVGGGESNLTLMDVDLNRRHTVVLYHHIYQNFTPSSKYGLGTHPEIMGKTAARINELIILLRRQ